MPSAAVAAALLVGLLAPAALAAPSAAKHKPCRHGYVRKHGRCVKKPAAKKKTAAPAAPTSTPAPPSPAMPATPAPSTNGPAVLDTIDFNKLLSGTRLYRKDAQGFETWDFCRSGKLNYHGEIPHGDDIDVTDWTGSFFYSSYAVLQGDVLEGVVNYEGPDPSRTSLVIDFYPANTVALLGTGPGEVAAYLRLADQAAGC
jgi:hypothetical protein